MFENFREKLQSVQQDFTSGIKTLSDKSKEAKVKKKQRREEYLPQYSAGLELLNRYEETWVTLHKRTKECAKAAEAVDGEVVMLSAHWERRRGALLELQEQLQQIPTFLTDLESITARVAELDAEHAQKVLEMEHAQQVKLKERQKYFEEAFQQDMEQYLSTGYLQITDRRACPIGSMSSMEVNVDMLEQMDLTDVSDHEALDVFLNSGGDENSSVSAVRASDAEISLKVPTHTELRQNVSSVSSSCTDSFSGVTEGPDEEEDEASDESSDAGYSPLVQRDEEEVQADTTLVGLLDNEEGLKNSDDSDTGTLMPSEERKKK
ncbi:dysbindin-A isoform X3 [Pangasianodon hypophthalmus]|uniref:dysbindin-A isoform X3 n=1 Tax=Pangasianodon hypophthalmus TaxID=310915 RepID=UPI0023076E54|nr:dysbindin-A isoform X3 [Pangasianodon hypophthalmus]